MKTGCSDKARTRRLRNNRACSKGGGAIPSRSGRMSISFQGVTEMSNENGWYYVKDGQTVGPISREALASALPGAEGDRTLV